MTTIYLLVLFLLGLFTSAIYSGLETGIYSVSRIRLQLLSDKDQKARELSQFLQKTQKMVIATLVGINLANYITTAAFTALLIYYEVGKAEIVSTIILTPIVFMFAENIPKQLFRSFADVLIYRLSWALKLSYLIFYPAILVLQGIGRLWGALLRQNPSEIQTAKQRIRHYLLEKGGLPQNLSQLTDNIFQIEESKVLHVTRPLKRTAMLEKNMTREEAVELARTYKYTRYPVYEKNPFHLVGFIHIYDVLLDRKEDFSLTRHLRPLVWIARDSSVPQAIETLQKARTPMGIVLGRQGKPVGIVTVKDLLEEVVGALRVW